MDETIKVPGLSKSYAGNKVISNIELSIGTGQVFGLLGANGAGKTTTIWHGDNSAILCYLPDLFWSNNVPVQKGNSSARIR